MTNTLYLPRRHRRPLLFPPGLLALAWLLWLGCVTLPQMRWMQPRQAVFQLSVDSKPFRNILIPLPLKDALVFPNPFMSPLELAVLRPWKDISFTGNLWADYFSYQQVAVAASELKEHNDIDSGVRVVFTACANYRSLIYTLDKYSTSDPLAKSVNYWLDILHKPTTVYAITSKPLPKKSNNEFNPDCLLCNDVIAYTPPTKSITFKEQVTEMLNSFLHPDWRNTTLLLLLLALLSAIRLYRQHHTS